MTMLDEKRMNSEVGTEGVVWDLADLYESPEDELIRDDLDLCRQEAELLVELGRGKLAGMEPALFARTIRRLERIELNLGRVEAFAYLNFSTRTTDAAAGAFLQRITEEASEIRRQLVFFDLEWARMAEEDANRLLADPGVAKYAHYLHRIRARGPHLLAENEEQLLLSLTPVGRQSWITLFDKVMTSLRFGEQQRTEEEVLADLYRPEREVRRQAARDLSEGLRGQLHVLTHIFNTLAAEKMIGDRLRRFPSWDAAMHLENEVDPDTVETMIESVTGRYNLVYRYYRWKGGRLGLDPLYDYDRYAPVPGLPDTRIGWDRCRRMVLDAFASFSPRMAGIAEQFFTGGWIHAPVAPGKQSGAFAHPCVVDTHPYVLVNYTGELRDVFTVAHELGHGVHQVLAAGQGQFNSDTPLVLAETASVFAEMLVFRATLDTLESARARQALLAHKLESIFATVFRQVSMNRFEKALHTARRQEGELSAERLGELWLASQQPMFADSVVLGEDYGIWWSYIPHFLSTPGYVYSYAFGELLVLALFSRYQREGEPFVERYLDLLAAGGARTPAELLAPFGIDLDQAGFWQGGLDLIETMLEELEGLSG